VVKAVQNDLQNKVAFLFVVFRDGAKQGIEQRNVVGVERCTRQEELVDDLVQRMVWFLLNGNLQRKKMRKTNKRKKKTDLQSCRRTK
jgi:hypothetical protein